MTEKKKTVKKSEAKLDMEIAFSPLFYTVKDEKRRPNALIRREHANGWIEFRCFERLSVFDESVVLALMFIANDKERTRYLTSSPKSDLGKDLRKIMDPENDLKNQTIGMIVDTDLNEIARIMGYKKPSKTEREYIKESIKRLSSVTISERIESESVEYHGIPGFIRCKIKDDGRLAFVIMRRLTMAAFGEKGWKFALVNLDERNDLRGDISKTLHKWLVAWIFDSKKRKKGPRFISLDKLAGHVWHDWDEYTPSGKRTMRQRLRGAIKSINALPCWSASVEGVGSMATIRIERLEPTTAALEEASEKSDLDGELPPYMKD